MGIAHFLQMSKQEKPQFTGEALARYIHAKEIAPKILQHHFGFTKVILFGSTAKNMDRGHTDRDPDIDLCAVYGVGEDVYGAAAAINAIKKLNPNIPILLWFARSLRFTLKGQQSRFDGYMLEKLPSNLSFFSIHLSY